MTPFPLPTADPIILSCAQRKPASDDLLVVITDAFGISSDYVPRDLVQLDKVLPEGVVSSSLVKVRRVMVEPLISMTTDMRAARLEPIVRSGYRSYYHQMDVYRDWQKKYPDRAGLVSTVPGHSEHQLGLAVDFGSPELPDLVGDPEIEFHSAFAETSEGKWLAKNAYKYGFTLSYPLEAYTSTGVTYEPWHYRYVGVELATYLHASGQFLTKFLMESRPVLPCVP